MLTTNGLTRALHSYKQTLSYHLHIPTQPTIASKAKQQKCRFTEHIWHHLGMRCELLTITLGAPGATRFFAFPIPTIVALSAPRKTFAGRFRTRLFNLDCRRGKKVNQCVRLVGLCVHACVRACVVVCVVIVRDSRQYTTFALWSRSWCRTRGLFYTLLKPRGAALHGS